MSDSPRRPHTPTDPQRLAVLRAYDLLDTPPDDALDRLAALAGALLDAQSAAVTLVDADRQWFKARTGIDVAETALEESLCAHTMSEPDGMLVIADARRDARFAAHAAITGPLQIGFYAGATLETSTGERLGALCVFDRTPREPTAEQLRALRLLAREVVARFELHRETQRRRIAEQRLAEAQQIAELGSWDLDLETGRLWWSDEVFRQFGIAPSEFGATYEAFIGTVHPEDRDAMEAAQARALSGEAPLDLVHRIVRPDGDERTVHERGELVRDRRGQAIRLVGTVQDVTARIAAETQLRASDARWRDLFVSAPRPMWVYDVETLRFLAVNDAAVATYGWSREEFLAMDLSAIRPVDEVARLQASIAAAPDGFERAGNWRHRWKDGREREVEIRSHPVQWEGRHARLVLADDVTEQREAERRLVALNEELRAQASLLDLANDAIVVHDLDGTVTYWNGGAARIFGWTAGEAAGRDLRTLISQTPAAFAEGMTALLSDGTWRGEERAQRRSGEELALAVSATLVRVADGAPRAAFKILTDVTAQRKLEAQLLRAQRLESIGTLASGIAHDLNNMLAPIVMSIQLLGEEVRSAEGQELLRTIEGSAKRGGDLVRQVLSFARGLEGARVPVAPATVAASVVRLLRDTLPRNVVVHVDIPDSLPDVTGDATQLQQVLLNLCVNARDAMPEGGVLSLRGWALTLDLHYARMTPDGEEGPFVCLEVTDTGVGIAPEMLDRIFDPFFTTKPVGEGTGLGLATVQAIARGHGGFVNVYSEPGKGTTFRVYLPATGATATTRHATPTAAGPPRGNGELILVVDDEAAIRTITRQTLETFGYRVLVAADGVDALTLFDARGAEIELVLTDMRMPRLDGPGLIRAVLDRDPAMRIVAVSGLGANGGVAKSAGMGVTHFLPKPYTASTLLRALAEALGRR